MTQILPPHNAEAEEAVLGSVLIDSEAATRLRDALRPEDFYIHKNGWVWAAVQKIVRAGYTPDLLTVGHEMETQGRLADVGGSTWLAQLTMTPLSALNVDGYISIVKQNARRRALIQASSDIAKVAWDQAEDIGEVQAKALASISTALQGGLGGGPYPAGAVVSDVVKRLEAIYRGEISGLGLTTGFRDLDKACWGMFPGDLIYVAARPRIGKSVMLGNIADYVARVARKHVMVFSVEMPRDTWMARNLAAVSGVDFERVRLGTLKEEDWGAIYDAAGKLGMGGLSEWSVGAIREALRAGTRYWIDDMPSTTDMDIMTKARQLRAEVGELGLIVVDYVQMVRSAARMPSRYQEVGVVSNNLKRLARELGVPVVAACMVGRGVEDSADKRPGLADLRESGNLEADADQVWLIHRDEVYDPDGSKGSVDRAGHKCDTRLGIAEVEIGKNRNGPMGLCELQFDKRRQRFADLAVRVDREQQY
jgi:replicative DNA helicase